MFSKTYTIEYNGVFSTINSSLGALGLVLRALKIERPIRWKLVENSYPWASHTVITGKINNKNCNINIYEHKL